MGSKDNNLMAKIVKKPRHSVEIPYDYWMARYPVTNDQFVKFVEGPYRFSFAGGWKKKTDHPVVNVSWYDALEYCRWLNGVNAKAVQMTVAQMRLPTEAEWEMAARGKYGNEWPWGNEFDQNKCNSSEGGQDGTMPVGSYSPQGDSPYGIADMVGNVWEWCHSLYAPYPYAPDKRREDETASGSRVLRGGSYNYSRSYARCAYRDVNLPIHHYHLFGFRVVIAPRLG
jgi:formylglycine-generating enzyme required for sulfatase activity